MWKTRLCLRTRITQHSIEASITSNSYPMKEEEWRLHFYCSVCLVRNNDARSCGSCRWMKVSSIRGESPRGMTLVTRLIYVTRLLSRITHCALHICLLLNWKNKWNANNLQCFDNPVYYLKLQMEYDWNNWISFKGQMVCQPVVLKSCIVWLSYSHHMCHRCTDIIFII